MNRVALCGCVPAGLGAFDFGFLALAAPRIAPELGASGAAYPWLFGASSFAYGAAVMPAAVATTRRGAVSMLAAGLCGSALGMVLFASAPGLAVALAGRAVFGVGGALAATAGIALLAGIAGEDLRRRAFAALGGAVAAGFAAGALLAGVGEWRVVMTVATTLVLAAALATARLPRADGDRSPPRGAGAPRGGATFHARPRAHDAGPLRGGALLSAAILACAAGSALMGASAAPLRAAAAAALVTAAVLAVAAVRRAAGWLPADRAPLAAVLAAGAATTASGVGATILLGQALADRELPTALLAIFGLGVLPGAALAARVSASASASAALGAGLSLQALALAATAAALAAHCATALLALVVVAFSIGHVAANGGAAEAVAALADGPPAPLASLLVASQYVGGGLGSLVAVAVAASAGPSAGVALAAALAGLGALAAAMTARAPRGRQAAL